MPKKIDEELKTRAVRLVTDHLGVGKESVRRWVIQAQVDGGQRQGVDGLSPVGRFVPPRNDPGQTASFYMQNGEVERIEVLARADRGWHEWILVLPLIVDGKSFDEAIDDDGSPFVTVGAADAFESGSVRMA